MYYVSFKNNKKKIVISKHNHFHFFKFFILINIYFAILFTHNYIGESNQKFKGNTY